MAGRVYMMAVGLPEARCSLPVEMAVEVGGVPQKRLREDGSGRGLDGERPGTGDTGGRFLRQGRLKKKLPDCFELASAWLCYMFLPAI